MAVPTAYTWVDGAKPGASVLNPGVRDPIAFLMNPPRVRAYRATAGTALTAATPTVVNLDGENYDSTATMHSLSSNLGRLVAPEDGVYQIVGQFAAVQNTGASSITVSIRANGVTAVADVRQPTYTVSAASTVAQVESDWPLSAGEYVEMLATLAFTASPSSGSNLTYMQMRWVATL